MNLSINKDIFYLKKAIRDIKNYNKEWRYADAFQRMVSNLNTSSRKLGLPEFQFEDFHFSKSTGKTIDDVGFNSLLGHIEILEDTLPAIFESNKRQENDNKTEEIKDDKKVFIVHGRDKKALLETETILRRMGLNPIILNRVANNGMTLIEKFEKYSNVRYAVVLLTPDDVGALYEDVLQYQFRARQNVIFELGFFYAKLGRSNVCCLMRSSVEKPSDIDGIAYLPYRESVEEIELSLLKEFKEAKLEVQIS
jgi:predicted nucleotide-binding protein